MLNIEVHVDKQILSLLDGTQLLQTYPISTAKNGLGEEKGSEKTPRGLHIIRAKIGAGCSPNTVFVGRRPTGEIFTPKLRDVFPNRDWILTRILWLSGCEVGKNRLNNVDTMQRYIYIHGAPDDELMGKPGSRGCIRMRNKHILVLFENVPVGTKLMIQP